MIAYCDICDSEVQKNTTIGEGEQKTHVCEQCKADIKNEEKEQRVIDKYGFTPKSIWYLKKDKTLALFTRDSIGADTYAQGAPLSEFNPVVAKKIIAYWSRPGDKVLDPFAGRTRLIVANNMRRHYTGYEISPRVYEYLKDRMEKQTRLKTTKTPYTLHNKDCRLMEYEEVFDLVFTCPPYWDVEDYNKLYKENIRGQMGSIHTYEDFIVAYTQAIQKIYVATKRGGFVVWVVNDIRRNKKLIPFHSDTIRVFNSVGFDYHDCIINELNSLSLQGLGNCEKQRYTAKCHEYILVFKKPA